MSEEINMNEDKEEEPTVVETIDCFVDYSDAFNTSHVLICFSIWLK